MPSRVGTDVLGNVHNVTQNMQQRSRAGARDLPKKHGSGQGEGKGRRRGSSRSQHSITASERLSLATSPETTPKSNIILT